MLYLHARMSTYIHMVNGEVRISLVTSVVIVHSTSGIIKLVFLCSEILKFDILLRIS